MNNAQCRKAYVSVNVDVDEEGTIHPCPQSGIFAP